MTVKYAKEIYNSDRGAESLPMKDVFAKGSCGAIGLYLSTTDDAGYHNIGGEDFGATAADTIILCGVDMGGRTGLGAIQSFGGDILLKSIEYVVSTTIPNHAFIGAKVYRNMTPAAGSQWAAVSGSIVKPSASAATVTFQAVSGGATATAICDTFAVGTTVATNDPNGRGISTSLDIVLRAGDFIALHGDGAGNVTAGVVGINVFITFERLTAGVRVRGMGDRV